MGRRAGECGMTKWNRKAPTFGAILVSALLALSLGACAGGQEQSPQQSPEQPSEQPAEQADPQAASQEPIDPTGGSPWIDSNLKDNIKPNMETSPKDDYYLYANYDWLLNTDIPEGDKVAGTRSMEGDGPEHLAKAITGDELTGHDARLAQLLYRAIQDTAARDAAGVEPARATLDAIRGLATIDDVSAFLLDIQKSAGVPTLVQAYINQGSLKDDGHYVPRIDQSSPTFGSSTGTMGMDATSVSPEDELYKTRQACASAVLTRLGMSEDEANAVFDHRVEFERRVIEEAAKAAPGGEEEEDGAEGAFLKLEDLDALAGAFPLRQLLEARGYGKATDYMVNDEAEIRAVCSLYTQDNIELIRDYLLAGYALEVSSWLDSQAFEAWRQDYVALGYYDQLSMAQTSPEERAILLVRSLLPTPTGRAYAEAYDLAHTKEFINKFCGDAIEAHKEIVNASKWLSDASKQRLSEKLDAITIKAVYPEVWEDYSGLELEGLSYYDMRRAIWLFDVTRNAALTNAVRDNRMWSDPTLVGTAHYEGATNSFVIPGGGVEGDVARYEAGEMSLAEFLGGPVGYLTFHESAHSLDPNDIKIGPHGENVEETLLEPADLKEFERRTQKAVDYYDGIVAFKGQNMVGSGIVNEGQTEINAMQARLAYAAHQDDFDYQAFFQKRAEVGRVLRTPELERQCILGADSHPSAYLDINGPNQMFEEFYQTFGVREGDGMYLAPEARLVFW